MEKGVPSPLPVLFSLQGELTYERDELVLVLVFTLFFKILKCNMPAGKQKQKHLHRDGQCIEL